MRENWMSARLWGKGFAILLVVLAGCAAPGPAPVSDRGAVTPPVARPGYYLVKPGDTLNAISRQTGVALRDLVLWNGLTSPNQISVGQELRIISPEAQARPGAPSEGVEIHPIGPSATPVPAPPPPPAAPPLKDSPRGGKVPYSDHAWSQAQAAEGGAAPAKPEPAPEAAPAPPPAATLTTPTPTPPPGAAAGDWLWPAEGKVISTFSDASGKGIDIAGKAGDPVVASAAGKVVYAGSGLRGYGKLVIIKHDDAFLTAYAHNRQLLVNEGQSVARGQKIAELGNTDADRPKLHFEIRRQGKPVDPLKYLPNR
jgi:lipoprotein NlpD